MIFARLSSFLREIVRFGARTEFHSNFHSKASRSRTKEPWQSSTTELYRRISPIGNPNVSIVPILDQWVEEGRSVRRESLTDIIRELRSYRRYRHALEVSMWMSDKKYYHLTSSDVAIRLDLISKAQGIEKVEKYFDNLSQKLKSLHVYGALIKCYATAKCVEKAEAVMQKMRDVGFANKPLAYNVMLTLYYKTGNMEKFDALLKEMDENGIAHDEFTLGTQLSAYAAVMDIERMDKIVMMLESNPKLVPRWIDYNVAATGYRKAGRLDKAFEMLKKAEAHLTRKPDVIAYNHLLTQYAHMGRKDEVLRVWSLYKKKYKVYNKGYSHVMNSLVKLSDFKMAEEIFDEWESQDDITYDMNIPNIMIGAYSRKGLIEKAEAFIDRAISKGGKPNAWTWYHLVEGFFQSEQPQKAVEMMKKTIVMLSGTEWEPVPEVLSLKACLKYLKGVGDTEQTEEFVKLLVDKDIISLDKLEDVSIDKDESLTQAQDNLSSCKVNEK